MNPTIHGYAEFPAVTGNYMSIPHDPEIELAPSFTVVAHFSPVGDWPISAELELMGWGFTGEIGWRARIDTGRLPKFYVSANGTDLSSPNGNTYSYTSTGTPMVRQKPYNNLWVAWCVTHGATRRMRGWASYNGEDWVPVGAALTAGGASLSPYDNNQPLYIGRSAAATPPAMNLYFVGLYDGIDTDDAPDLSTPVRVVDFSAALVGVASDATSFTATTGETVTVTRAGSGIILHAPDDYTAEPVTPEPGAPAARVERHFTGRIKRRAGRRRPVILEHFTQDDTLPTTLERLPDATGGGVTCRPVDATVMLDPGIHNGCMELLMQAGTTEGVQSTRLVHLGAASSAGTPNWEIGWYADFTMSSEITDLTLGIGNTDEGMECGVELFLPRSTDGDPSAQVRLLHPGGYELGDTLTDLFLGGSTVGCWRLGLRVLPVDGIVFVEESWSDQDGEARPIRTCDFRTDPTIVQGPARFYIKATSPSNSRRVYVRQLYGFIGTQ